ncbi:Zn-ribbon domain-containing OB-fold protein [Kitasatospora sp. NPDC088134]|uniref:Zn-ribbon domain-containing OB-fold protein n=1 Tax=Kitasatospora sp. NPDC088134 TaxID=3364071 RepID=UPI00380B218E
MTLTLAPAAPTTTTPPTPFAPTPPTAAAPGESELGYLRCHWCHSASATTCLLCPVCGSADLEPAAASGRGTVQRLLRPTRRGPHLNRPYLIVLDEGFTVQAAVLGGLPGAVPIGAQVQLVTSEEGGRVLTFRLAPRI